MKKVFLYTLAAVCAGLVSLEAASAPAKPLRRNTGAAENRPKVNAPILLGGLAPTTWGFAAQYSGSAYGTGYYPFRVDLTYAGTNSIYGYTFNYPSFGFVNEVRAIYAFDVSGIVGQVGPVWSSFMFDTRERPPAGTTGLSAFQGVELHVAPKEVRLRGTSLFLGDYASNLDVYDAEDFENAAPFVNPELAFVGSNTLIGTVPVTSETPVPIDLDVTTAVDRDLGGLFLAELIPTLGTIGLVGFVALLVAAGVVLIRRNGIG